VGISYFDERYRETVPPDPDSMDYVAARIAYRVQHDITEDTKFKHGVEAYPSLEDQDDIYLQMRTELITKIQGNLFGSVEWILDYDSTPAPDPTREIEKLDNRVLLSVGWSF
jgi:hypothetical protein